MRSEGRAAIPAERPDWPRIAVLVALCVLPLLPALPRLGLYGDDYGMLASFAQMRGEPVAQQIAAIFRDYAPRPGQGVSSALLYFAFGLDPLPYLLVQTAVVAACVLLLWMLLRRLQVEPVIAFGAAALFALLPQLSTVRIWFAALCVAAAMAFFLAGALYLLRWLDERRARWNIAALLSWALSLSFYEMFVPFMVAMLAFAGWRLLERKGGSSKLAKLRPLLPHLVLILAALAAKALVTDRADSWNPAEIAYQALRLDYDRQTDLGFNAVAFVTANYVETFALPLRSLATFALGRFLGEIFCALLAALLVALALAGFDWAVERRRALTALALGFAASLLGYGIYVLVPAATFTAAGIGNRSMVAGASGVGLAIAAAIVLASGLAGRRFRRPIGISMFALLAVLLSLTTARIAGHWASAYEKQQDILRSAKADLASVPAGSAVLLDGFCPYDGPAIVFETDWDVTGALSLALGRPVIGNVITESTRFGGDGVSASIYDFPFFYRYGPGTYAYDPARRSLVVLRDRNDARDYLASRRAPDCPQGYAGHGVPI